MKLLRLQSIEGFDTADFVAELGERWITPHVAQNAYDTGTARRQGAAGEEGGVLRIEYPTSRSN